VTDRDGITLWDLEKHQAVASFPLTNWAAATNFEGDGPQLAFTADGEQFAESSFNGSLSMVSVHRSTNASTLFSAKVPAEVSALAWQPRGRWLAVTDFGGSVTLVDPTNGETRIIGHHKAEAVTASFSPDGNYLFTGGWERVLICWDMLSLQSSFIIPLEAFNIQFRSDGAECALAGESTWQLHAFEHPATHRQLPEPLGSKVRYAAISPDGHWLAVAGFERLGVWNLHSTGPAALTTEGRDCRLFFSAQNELFGCSDDECHAWRVREGQRPDSPPTLQEFQVPERTGFLSFCQAPSGVLMSSSLGSRLIDNGSGQTPRTTTGAGVSSSSPDGHWMGIFTPYSRVARIYCLPELALASNLTNRDNISFVQFSPRGSEVAVGMVNEIQFWSTTTWQQTRLVTNAANLIYTPRANGLWLARNYRTAGLYSAATLEPLLPLPRGMLPLALSPDGRYLAVSSDAQGLELWDLSEVQRQLQDLGLSWPVTP
jgi:WD40 repeat protein